MGESACPLRSFAHPFDTFREGGPIRALKESVSFGRFMSESLDWERWSTFSHNRYLEEVEKLFKPGTVAQRKAYFEACYQKRAAMKMATTALEVATTATNYVPEIESTRKIQQDFQVDTNSAIKEQALDDISNPEVAYLEQATNFVPEIESTRKKQKDFQVDTKSAINKQEFDDISNPEIAFPADANTCQPSTKTEEITMVEGSDAIAENNVHMESSLENSELLGKTENYKHLASPEENMPDNRNFTISRTVKEANSSSKSLVHCGGSGDAVSQCRQPRQSTLMQARERNEVALNGKTFPRNLNDTRTSTSKSLQMSINLASHAAETNKALTRIPKDSLAPLQPTLIHVKTRNNNLPNSKLASGGSNTKKRLIPNSLHMSMNFGPHTGESSKASCKMAKISSTTVQTTSVQSRNENIHPNRIIFAGYSNRKKRSKPNFLNASTIASQACEISNISPRMPKDDSNPARASAKASVSAIPPHPFKSLHTEAKRTCKTNIPLNKSVSGGITTNGKWHSSVDHARSLNSSKARAQSTIFFPFSFKSEERAAKRNEFFKKLEEENKRKAVKRGQQSTRRKHL